MNIKPYIQVTIHFVSQHYGWCIFGVVLIGTIAIFYRAIKNAPMVPDDYDENYPD